MRARFRVVLILGVVVAMLGPAPSTPANPVVETIEFVTNIGVGPAGVCNPGLGPVGVGCVPLAPTPPQAFFIGPVTACVAAGTLGVDAACGVASGGTSGPVVPGVGPHCGLAAGDSVAPPADFVTILAVPYPVSYGFVLAGEYIVVAGAVTVGGHAHPFHAIGRILAVTGLAPGGIPCVTTPAIGLTVAFTGQVLGP